MKKIEVKLIDFTTGADKKLIYTKNTRLELGDDTRAKVDAMCHEEVKKELEYMANTIPSSWEFVNYTFEIRNVTRAFTHQFVRTRTGSYAQQTMRMLNMDGFSYLIPETIKNDSFQLGRYQACMDKIQETYSKLVESGIPEEDARGVLPTNIHTNIIAQFNLRTMADLAKSRTGGRTQSEYVQVFTQMVDAVLAVHPWAEAFMFQDKKPHWDRIEELLGKAFEGGALEKSEKYDGLKALDKIKKG